MNQAGTLRMRLPGTHGRIEGNVKRQGYISEIDGLRAIAVAGIILFHGFPHYLTGGFVGVDVFFVISGYLITGIIEKDSNEGKFSFLQFYMRRAFRILPAYIFINFVVCVFALTFLTPDLLKATGLDLSFSSIFAINFHFRTVVGYFDPGAFDRPLIHLWSLAVEEQLYIVWPTVLAILAWQKIRSYREWLILGALAASLGLAQLALATGHGQFAFFMTPSRMWEFILGGALALRPTTAWRPAAVQAEAMGILGVVLILASMVGYTSETPFPGLTALMPCVGAALVIFSSERAPIRSLVVLRNPASLFIGRISYSLYLWHWPLIVFCRQIDMRAPTPVQASWAILISVLLSLATWRLIEIPFRVKRDRKLGESWPLFTGLVVLGVTGLAFWATDGFPQRLDIRTRQILSSATQNPLSGDCLDDAKVHDREVPPKARCYAGARPSAADRSAFDILVWGDSHADAATPALIALGQRNGATILERARPGCPPILGASVYLDIEDTGRQCAAFNATEIARIKANPAIEMIVLAARWPSYLNSPGSVDPEFADFSPEKRRFKVVPLSRSREPFAPLESALERTMDALDALPAKPHVVMIGPVPELPFSPSRCVASRYLLGASSAFCEHIDKGPVDQRLRDAEAMLRRVATRHPRTTLVLPRQRMCGATACAAIEHDASLYFDDDHLSAGGARRILEPMLADITTQSLARKSAGPRD